MKKIFLILTAAVMMTTFAACSSDEPQGSENEFVPPVGPFEPLSNEIRPVLTEGKKWILSVFDYMPPKQEMTQITCVVTGDTTVSLGKGKIITQYREDGSIAEKIILKEENGKIYHFDNCEQHAPRFQYVATLYPSDEDVAADFSWRDSGSMPLQGKLRRSTRIIGGGTQYDGYWYDYFVEGIGCLFLSKIAYSSCIGMTGGVVHYRYEQIEKCYDGDELIYDRNEFNDIIYTPETWYKPEMKKEQIISRPY